MNVHEVNSINVRRIGLGQTKEKDFDLFISWYDFDLRHGFLMNSFLSLNSQRNYGLSVELHRYRKQQQMIAGIPSLGLLITCIFAPDAVHSISLFCDLVHGQVCLLLANSNSSLLVDLTVLKHGVNFGTCIPHPFVLFAFANKFFVSYKKKR